MAGADGERIEGPSRRPRHAVATLRHRDFRLFSLGALLSNLGTWAQYVGIGWAARGFTDSELLLGVAFAAQFAPALLLSPFAGVVADRFDRRRLVIIGNLLMVLPPLAIAFLIHRGAANLTNLIALVFAGGVAQAFTMPATQAFVPALVPRGDMQQAVSLNAGLQSATRVVGPGLGAAAIKVWGVAGGFAVNAVSFFAVVVACLFVRARPIRAPAPSEPFGERLRAGFRYARTTPVVGYLLLLVGMATFVAMQAPLLPIFAKDVLHGDVSTYATLASAPGIGAVIALLFVGELRSDRVRRVAIMAGVVGIGIALATLAASRVVPLSVVALGLFGLSYFLLSTLGTTMMMEASADEYRGRIMGLLGTASTGMVPINSLLAGVIASAFGAPLTVAACGATMLAFATWFAASGRAVALRTGPVVTRTVAAAP